MSRKRKAAAIRRVMEVEGEAVTENAEALKQRTDRAIDGLEGYEALREQARAIKAEAIAELPSLIEAVTDAVEANGGEVYVADDAADANQYVETALDAADADHVVRSNSTTTEELALDDHLEASGYAVTETDLGEFVLGLAEESPSHPVEPAMHRSAADIAALFNHHFNLDEPLPADPARLAEFARERIGDRIRGADAGITGAKFVVADSGTLALAADGGGARKAAVAPPTHVAVAGVETLVPELGDLQPFVELLGRASTGRDIPSSVSLLRPPVETPAVDFAAGEYVDPGERSFHLVLVDNGRMAMRDDDQLRETLYCIGCGACANSCANFQSVGGHAFGGETYTGGIGAGWEAAVHGLESAGEANDLCTGCSRCVERCPVKIDIPWVNTVVRSRRNDGDEAGRFDFLVSGLTPEESTGATGLQRRVFGNVGTVLRLGGAFPLLSNAVLQSTLARPLLEASLGIDARRELPEFASVTFRERVTNRERVADADREVVLYVDPYTNYFHPERGEAALAALQALGCSVHVPAVPESGRAPLSEGMIEAADSQASAVYGILAEHIDAGRDVVVVEPSDVAMFRGEYERLLPPESAERLASHSYELFEYLYGLIENGADASALTVDDRRRPGPVTFHSHCHQQTLGLEAYTVAVLEAVGYDVRTTDAECCGLAGGFGYKSQFYELSVDVGERLVEELAEGPVVASGTSCCEQVSALTDRRVRHPATLLWPK